MDKQNLATLKLEMFENTSAMIHTFLCGIVERYFEKRGLPMPNSENALHFLVSEIGELSDAVVQDKGEWIRNNPEKTRDIADEVGDVLMMLLVFCIQRGMNPIACMKNKMRRKLKDRA